MWGTASCPDTQTECKPLELILALPHMQCKTGQFLLLLLLLLLFDPGTQFPGKKNYSMQRQNTKTSWNGLYSSSSFTKL